MNHQQNNKTGTNQINQTMKKNMSICFQTIDSDTFYQIKLHLRAGKIGEN